MNRDKYLLPTFFLVASACAFAQEIPQGVVLFSGAKIQWEKSGAGERANLVGDQAKPGPYVYLTKPKPGIGGASVPHTHPDNRTYTIIAGTWYVGFGTKYDESKLIALPAGSYYTEPAGVPHFVVIRDGGVIVQVQGTGPSRLNPVDAK